MDEGSGQGLAVEVGASREHFVDERWHQIDLDAIWKTQWNLAGHADEVCRPGDFITYRLGVDEAVITRTKQGPLAAYHNFCRHRGHPLVSEESGQVGRQFTCPYHGWSYAIADGACLGATRMNEGFDKTPWSLLPVWVEEFHGLVFVSFASERPIPIADQTRHLTGDGGLAGFDLDRLKVAARRTRVIDANWKIVVENDEECYHCSLNHPELVESYDPWSGFTVADDLDNRPQLWTDDPFPIVELGANRYGKDSLCALPLPRIARAEEGTEIMAAQWFWRPGGHLALNADYAWIFNVKPVSQFQTQLTQYWLVNDAAEEGRDYDVDTLTWLFETTMTQDERLCDEIQRGMTMTRYTPGPLNPHHQSPAITFYHWYERLLAEHERVSGGQTG